MRILVIEDHQEVWQWMATEFRHRGWQAHHASSADHGILMARHGSYDTILLDIMLPDQDGLAVCKALRQFTRVSIIMVTARSDIRDRVQALNDGADDYLVKPFAMDELVARIQAVHRRRFPPAEDDVLEWGDLRMFVNRRVVQHHEQELRFSRREFDLLKVFMEHPGQVMSREVLLERAWGYDFYGESNVVDVTVRRLREHLTGSVSIGTVRGLGYIMHRGPSS